MEEEKAAAYYDELSRKGEGAAKFKQGLGFSSASNDAVPSRGSALSSSSFLSTFIKASIPSKTGELQKQAQLESIQNKLNKKPDDKQTQIQTSSRVSRDRDRDNSQSSRRGRSRSRSHDRNRDRSSRRRSRSRSRSRDKSKGRHSRRRSRSRSRDNSRRPRRRSRSVSRDRDRHSRQQSRSRDDYRRRRGHRSRSRERDRESGSRRRKSRSESPQQRKSEKKSNGKVENERESSAKVDYGKLIEGYDHMTPAERVKAKMKLQLSETAEKDETKGMGKGWERFDFDKDAPLDDEEIEVAGDDGALVKQIGQSFRFSAVEAKREEELKAAHDEAMFGTSSTQPCTNTDDNEEETYKQETRESAPAPVATLISDQVLTMQQGSWRDRIRKA